MLKYLFVLFCLPTLLSAQSDSTRRWNLHGQSTVIPQYHFNYHPKTVGDNTLQPSEPVATSFTATLYAGYRVSKRFTMYFNPEASGGTGLSGATGMAGFANGESFRIGSPTIKPYIGRLFGAYQIPLGKDREYKDDDMNQVRGYEPTHYLMFRVGKISIADYFDNNTYSHDPRTGFLNWSLMSAGAWDYPANTRGYTMGLVTEWVNPAFAVRFAFNRMPVDANGSHMDWHLNKAFGAVLEGQKNIGSDSGKHAVIRAGIFLNKARMGSYNEAIYKGLITFSDPDIIADRRYGRDKVGFYLNGEYDLGKSGLFARLSYNDGKNETWAFTEIDRSAHIGWVLEGVGKRRLDHIGVAAVINGLSKDHRNYLAAGGYGFIIGDGALDYSTENIAEAYYAFDIPKAYLTLTADYQFVLHPAYNKSNGSVHVAALRMHFAL